MALMWGLFGRLQPRRPYRDYSIRRVIIKNYKPKIEVSMTIIRIRLLLFATILVMMLGPLVGSFYYLNNSLKTALNLGFNAEILEVLSEAQSDLRLLGDLDANNENQYRERFEKVEELRQIYSNSDFFKANITGSMNIYFALGIGTAVLLSLVLALVLSRKIDLSYRRLFTDLQAEKEKVSYLKEISTWQDLARMLAHEIKNPLTPIEVSISSLKKTYHKKSADDFELHLSDLVVLVSEELSQLKTVVNNFSDFAKVPKVKLKIENLENLTEELLKALSTVLPAASIDSSLDTICRTVQVQADRTMLRQVFINIIRNGMEANIGTSVKFDISVRCRGTQVIFHLSNNGHIIPEDIAPRIFNPYLTTHQTKSNLGLGLAVVKKIIIEHGGEIEYQAIDGRPTFIIILARVI